MPVAEKDLSFYFFDLHRVSAYATATRQSLPRREIGIRLLTIPTGLMKSTFLKGCDSVTTV